MHVTSRGDRREPIFKDDTDRKFFLQTMDEACEKTGWAHPCLVSHAQPFSSGDRDAPIQPLGSEV